MRQKFDFERSTGIKELFQRFFFPNVAVRTTVCSGEVLIISIDHGVRTHLLSGASASLVKALHGQ